MQDGGIERGLEALLLEARRVDQFGYLQSELDRAKQNMLRAYERANAERDKTNSDAFVEEYVGNYLEGEAIPGIAAEYRLVQQLLPGITLREVNAAAQRWITDENRVVIATAPEKPGVKAPTAAELLAVFGRTGTAQLTAYTEQVPDAALVAVPPTPGRITASRSDSAVGVTEWTLGNGARVLVKPTDFKADEILFTAYANGGTSVAADADFMSASLASQIVALSGVGTLSRVDLGKRLAGKAVRVVPSISETTHGLVGNASPKDLETLVQLAHLYVTAPRLDSAAMQAFRNQVAPFLANRGADPSSVFIDTVRVTMTQHSFRARPLTAATFAEVDPARALAFYRDRYADAANFTFVFVGNVDTTALKPLVERYLASLPATGRREGWRNVSGAPPTGRRGAGGAEGARGEGDDDADVHRAVHVHARGSRRAAGARGLPPDQGHRDAARAARRHVQSRRGRRRYADAPAGVLAPDLLQLVDGERRAPDADRARADRHAAAHGSERGGRREGQGADAPRSRDGDRAERLLAGEHRCARPGGGAARGAARRLGGPDPHARRRSRRRRGST